jgi:uncharacterized membrane protein
MSYSLLKLLHVAAVIIFLGNIITGHFWMHIAMKSKDLKIIRHSILGVIKSDRIFTIPGVIFILAGGVLAAVYGRIPILRTGWVFWSILMFALSGVIFSTKLSAYQRKIYELSLRDSSITDLEWHTLNTVYAKWKTWGFIAISLPLAALAMMILKIPH